MENDEIQPMSQNGLGFFQQSVSHNLTRFFLDEEIMQPSYYRNLLQILLSANEGDIVELWINSCGGDLSSAESIIAGIMSTEARVLGVLNGKAYSAASMIALNCHELIVLPTASLMAHEATYAAVGKGSDIRSYTEFSNRKIDQVIDQCYEGFLTPEEIAQVKVGKEIWMLADEIIDRLQKRDAYYEEKAIEEELAEQEPPKPQRKRTRKKEDSVDGQEML